MAYAVKKSTRHSSDVWLIGQPINCLPGRQLPTTRQVLQLYFFLHKVENKTIRESSSAAINATENLWLKSRVPTILTKNSISKLEKIIEEFNKLKKNLSRQTETQKINEERFQKTIDLLFDIAPRDALSDIKIEEDRKFLLDQRGERKLFLGSVDMKLAKTEKSKSTRQIKELQRSEKEFLRKEKSEELIELHSSTSTSSSDSEIGRPGPSYAQAPALKKARKMKAILTPEITSALDRAKVSDRMAVHTVAASALGLGYMIDEICISRSTVQRARQLFHQSSHEKYKEEFNPDAPLVVHWDGKLLEDITVSENIERLSILITGRDTEILLGVPKLKDSKGETMVSAIYETIQYWDANLNEKICGMSFDTTASNTGVRSGACTLLEQKLEKPLLYLACRHHVLEIVIADLFKLCFGVSSGPVIPLFKRFKERWQLIKKDDFKSAKEDGKCAEDIQKMSESMNDVIEFVNSSLQEIQPRDDYQELLELTLIFFGENPVRGVHFRKPGAYHHARWMAKVIYAIKIWLFRDQFK